MVSQPVLCLGSARLVEELLGVVLGPPVVGQRCLVLFGCIPLGVIKAFSFSEKAFDSFLMGGLGALISFTPFSEITAYPLVCVCVCVLF